MLPNYARKMLRLNDLRSEVCIWEQKQEKVFVQSSQELCSDPVFQPYSLTKEATVNSETSEEAIRGFLSQDGHAVIYVTRKLANAERN